MKLRCKTLRKIVSRRTDLLIMDQFIENVMSNTENTATNLVDNAVSLGSNGSEYSFTADWYKSILCLYNRNLGIIAESLSSLGFSVAELFFRLDSQGLAGSGSGVFKAVFEVGLNVDPVLGVPYYPGSTVKGAVRSLTSELYGDDVAKVLFGYSSVNEGRVGQVFFSDMYPVGCSRMECSVYRGLVVNPHYYRGGEPVEDELQVKTNPVVHVGISEGLVFGLVIGVRPIDGAMGKKLSEWFKGASLETGDDNKDIVVTIKGLAERMDARSLAMIVSILTIETLAKGIAARSNKGYNVFTPVDDVNQKFTITGYRFKTEPRGGRSG
jgi:CRISPR-associated protein Cmr6